MIKRTILSTALLLLCSATFAGSFSTTQDKTSYAMGMATGKALKAHDTQINTNAFADGLNAGYSGAKAKMNEQTMQATLATFEKSNIAKMQAQAKLKGESNLQKGKAFLASNAKQKGVITTKNGLQYKVITKGDGTSPKASDSVTVDYEGTLIDGSVFDSSYKRGQPATFPVNGVIAGWTEALQLMKPGSVWMLYIPANLAYGARGAGSAIGPNETLIFKVHLIKVN